MLVPILAPALGGCGGAGGQANGEDAAKPSDARKADEAPGPDAGGEPGGDAGPAGPGRGVYSLGRAQAPVAPEILASPDVAGIAVRARWDALEASEGVFDWTYLDGVAAAAAAAGKRISLSVTAGIRTPAWVYGAGAQAFKFIDDGPYSEGFCTESAIPVPWDAVFLSKWAHFVGELGRRYGTHPALAHVKITGIAKSTQETMLPKGRGTAVTNGKKTCTTHDDVAAWMALGYTRLKVRAAWRAVADAFAAAFPERPLAAMLVPAGFPPIDDAGALIPKMSGDPVLARQFIADGRAAFAERFVPQNNGLSDHFIWGEITAVADKAATGHQMLWFVTGDASCRMHGSTPCDGRAVLDAAVKKGLAGGARYLEIYAVDVANPALGDVIASAHRALSP